MLVTSRLVTVTRVMLETNVDDAAKTPDTVRIERDSRGGWQVELPGSPKPAPCETLEEARRVAHLSAAHGRASELIVRDAYHRVLQREVIRGSSRSRRGRRT